MVAETLVINDRPYNRPQIDIENAPFWCFPGRAIFATPKHDEQNKLASGLILPDRHTTIRRLPVATCVKASPDLPLVPGNDYIVHQGYAKRVQKMRIGDWDFSEKDGELWLFGCVSPAKGDAVSIKPDAWLFAELVDRDGKSGQPEKCPFGLREVSTNLKASDSLSWRGNSRVPVGTCILSLPKPATMRNGLHLIDRQHDWPDMAVVLDVSPACKYARPGMVVWYQRKALHGWGHLPEISFASIHETAIFAAVDA